MNKHISTTGEINVPVPIDDEELSQSIKDLKKIFDNNECNNKTFMIKSAYELGYYYYMLDDYNTMKNYMKICLDLLESNQNLKIYFDKENIISLIKFCENENEENKLIINLENDIEMQKMNNFDVNSLNNVSEDDFANLFAKISINQQQKIILDNFSIDDLKTFEIFSIDDMLIYSKNLIFIAFKNYSKLPDAVLYVNKVKEIIIQKLIANLSDAEKREMKIAEKENSYHSILLSLIEAVYQKEEKLNNRFLTNLSTMILKITLTEDLQISGMIHGLIINFTQSFTSIVNYFNDFVEFFQKTSNNIVDQVNQIYAINYCLNTINSILYQEHPNNSFVLEGQAHYNLFNILFYWLTSLKEGKSTKYNNILFILIRVIKNSDFLKIMKIIYLAILKFVFEKRSLSKNSTDEVFDQIYLTNPHFFKLENIINENKTLKKFSNLNIIFKEDNRNVYNFDANNLDHFEVSLIKLINKCENKIIKYSSYTEKEIQTRRVNLLFLEHKIHKIPNEKIIREYAKYFQLYFHEFRVNYFKSDFIEDFPSKEIEKLYNEFKRLLDETILYKFIYILSSLGLSIEGAVLLQYTKKIDYDLAYKLIKHNSEFHKIDKLEYIWKIAFFELLANLYYLNNKFDHVDTVKDLIRRTSNHQYFKGHPLRKHFKILNFFKFIDNII